MGTYQAKPLEVGRKWHVIDAKDQILGRLVTQIATLLRGKHRPQFTPHIDTGDFVVVTNAELVRFTGKKLTDKIYYNHSQFVGGLRRRSAREVLQTKPEELIRRAVWGMLPKNALSKKILKKLKVYRGDKHPHLAQQAIPYKLKESRANG